MCVFVNGKGVDVCVMIVWCLFVFIIDDVREARVGIFECMDWCGIVII